MARFRDIASFLLRKWHAWHDHTSIQPEFWGVPVSSGCWCWAERSQNLKLICREIVFEVFQLDGRTDRQTDVLSDNVS